MPNPDNWFEVRNAVAAEAEILIYNEIGRWGLTAAAFIAQLKGVTAKTINLRIHSPGGGITEGTAIYNAIQRHPARVITHIDGLAASMASVVALAGDEVRMADNAMLMIHNPWSAGVGDADEMRKTADLLETFKKTIVGAYAAKTKLPEARLSKLMDDETWMTAEEAKKLGFVDVVTTAKRASASIARDFDLSHFAHSPAEPLAIAQKLSAVLTDYNGMTAEQRRDAFRAHKGELMTLPHFRDTRMMQVNMAAGLPIYRHDIFATVQDLEAAASAAIDRAFPEKTPPVAAPLGKSRTASTWDERPPGGVRNRR